MYTLDDILFLIWDGIVCVPCCCDTVISWSRTDKVCQSF